MKSELISHGGLYVPQIVNSVYDSDDYKEIHKCLTYWSLNPESSVNEAITKMVSTYPDTVLKNFILRNIDTPENYVFFTKKLANNLAYTAFRQYVFNYGNLIRHQLQLRYTRYSQRRS